MTEPTEELTLAGDFAPATRDQWLKLVEKVLAGARFEQRLVSTTADGIRVEPLYMRSDVSVGVETASPLPARKLAGAPWDIRQLHADPDPVSTNAAILEDLQGGATSVTLQIEAAGQFGLPPGKDALAAALKDVRLDACPIALRAGAGFVPAAQGLQALWRERGTADGLCRGAFNADPLGTLAAGGYLGEPVDQALQAAASLAGGTLEQPHVTALLADGHVYHAGGAGEVQELAAVAGTLVAYLRALDAAGIPPERALSKITINLAVDADQFLSIAKLRAVRRLIGRIADACGAAQAATQVPLTAETAWRMMTKRDPWVNMLRTTIACASAAMGGADAITVLPYTWALGQPDSFARRIARNTHLVLSEESGLGRVADPAAGSWYMERLTDELARSAWAMFQDIEAKGGMASCLGSGFIQDAIAGVAHERAKAIARGKLELTGVSAFPRLGDDGVTATPWPAPAPVTGLPLAKPLARARLAEPFERLRDEADAFAARTGAPLRVLLARLGGASDFVQRSTWAQNLLASGGIETVASEGLETPEAAGVEFAGSGAAVACLCSSDAVYARLAESAARAIKAAGARHVYLAGRPRDGEAALRAAGIDDFLSAGQDAVATLTKLQGQLGRSP